MHYVFVAFTQVKLSPLHFKKLFHIPQGKFNFKATLLGLPLHFKSSKISGRISRYWSNEVKISWEFSMYIVHRYLRFHSTSIDRISLIIFRKVYKDNRQLCTLVRMHQSKSMNSWNAYDVCNSTARCV